MDINGFDRFVTHLFDITADGQSWRSLFDDESAHAAMSGFSRRVGLCEQQEDLSIPAISHPHFGARDVVCVPIAAGSRRDRLQIRACVGFRQTDAAAGFAFGESWQEATLLILCAKSHEHIAQHRVRADDSGQPHPTSG